MGKTQAPTGFGICCPWETSGASQPLVFTTRAPT